MTGKRNLSERWQVTAILLPFLQGFRQFCKVADMFVEAPDVTYFWRRQAPVERLKGKLPRGVWGHAPRENFKNEHSETLFPAFLDTKYQFPRQGWSSPKFSLKVKYFMKPYGQMVGDGGGGWRQRNFQLFIIANLFFINLFLFYFILFIFIFYKFIFYFYKFIFYKFQKTTSGNWSKSSSALTFLFIKVRTKSWIITFFVTVHLAKPKSSCGYSLPSFIRFISPTDVRPTRVMCFSLGFPFQLGRAGMKTKWSLQFRWNETGKPIK